MQPRPLEHQLQNEIMAREIRNCTDIEELKTITLDLLELYENRESIMRHWMHTH